MNVVVENDVSNVKRKMTEIRRSCRINGKGKILNNYYNNCDQDEEIYIVYGDNTVVFWDNDNDVVRGYFYSSDETELIEMLRYFPKGCVVDIITRSRDEYKDILQQAGLEFHCEMHRFVCDASEETKQRIRERDMLMAELYNPKNVRSAAADDLELVYNKLHEVFDAAESHLPSRNELLELIEKRWVSLYFESTELKAVHIFKIEAAGRNYGYLTYNGTGIDAYYSVLHHSKKVYFECLRELGIDKDKVPPGYAWGDISNKKAIRGIKYGFAEFDGLIDYVWIKR